MLRALCGLALGICVASTALAQTPIIIPKPPNPPPTPTPRPPIIKQQVNGDPMEWEDSYVVSVEGDYWEDMAGDHTLGTRVRNTVPIDPRKLYDEPPKIQMQTQPPSRPNPNPHRQRVPIRSIVAVGPSDYPNPYSPFMSSFDPSDSITSGYLVTEFNSLVPFTVSLVTDLNDPNQVPQTVTLDGAIFNLDWDFSDFPQTTGRFFLLSADIEMDSLVTPEPATLSLIALSLMLLRRRR